MTAAQRSVLKAAIRAETRTGQVATLKEIAAEHGTTLANVRQMLKPMVPLGFVGEIKRGKHVTYFAKQTAEGEPFDRAAAHRHHIRYHGQVSAGEGSEPDPEAAYGVDDSPFAELARDHPDAFKVVLGREYRQYGLFPGDEVWVEEREAEEGELVIDEGVVVLIRQRPRLK